MVQRVQYRRRLSYNTKSNKTKIVKTPGAQLRLLHIKKKAGQPKCGDCGHILPGIAALRPTGYMSISRRQKTVNRAYGGSRCSGCVRSRIIRAFLVEEQKIVKKVLKLQQEEVKKAAAASAAADKKKNKKKAAKK